MNIIEQISKMKSIMKLNENFMPPDLTPEYIQKRVPFVKSFHDHSNDKMVRFDKIVNNPRVTIEIGGDFITIDNITTTSSLVYSRNQMDKERYRITFVVANNFWLTPPQYQSPKDQLNFMVYRKALEQMEKQLSYTFDEVIKSPTLPEDHLDKIINEINGKFFEFEEYVSQNFGQLKNPLDESIHPSEAYNDWDGLMTVIEGKRNLVFLTKKGSSKKGHTWEDMVELIKKNNLMVMDVPKNEFEAYIVYKPYAHYQAKQLHDIADKYDGFLSGNATIEDSYKIGQLLEYNDKDIWDYLIKNYPTNEIMEFKNNLSKN